MKRWPNCGYTDVRKDGKTFVCTVCGRDLGSDFLTVARAEIAPKEFERLEKERRARGELRR